MCWTWRWTHKWQVVWFCRIQKFTRSFLTLGCYGTGVDEFFFKRLMINLMECLYIRAPQPETYHILMVSKNTLLCGSHIWRHAICSPEADECKLYSLYVHAWCTYETLYITLRARNFQVQCPFKHLLVRYSTFHSPCDSDAYFKS